MVIDLPPTLEAALRELAQRRGVAPEALALDALRESLIAERPPIRPVDDWERRLFGAALDCGVSIPNSALSSEGLYE